jgi:hypothetical protein
MFPLGALGAPAAGEEQLDLTAGIHQIKLFYFVALKKIS